MDAHQTTIYNAVLIAGIFIGIIIIYFFISIIGHQRRNQALYKSKILAEITTLEKERQRISADLHDELGPLLASVKFKMSSIDIQNEQDQISLEKADHTLDEVITRIRGIAYDLLPTTLLRKGLIEAMQESVERLNLSANLEIKFAYADIPTLRQDKEVNLFRILQEIIHNTIKHAKATELKIEIRTEGPNIIVLTKDNGTGFDYASKSNKPTGLGLRNLLSRTEVLGGNMFIESQPGKGTRYSFEIPINTNP